MEICLDTSIIIDLLRKKEKTVKQLLRLEFTPAITAVTVAELYMGERKDEKLDLVLKRLKFYPLDYESSRLAGKIYRALKKRGELIEFRDILIAAICIKHGIPLLTKNTKHFKRLEEYGLTVTTPEKLAAHT